MIYTLKKQDTIPNDLIPSKLTNGCLIKVIATAPVTELLELEIAVTMKVLSINDRIIRAKFVECKQVIGEGRNKTPFGQDIIEFDQDYIIAIDN